MKSRHNYWIVGVGLAIVGIIIARVIAGRFADQVGYQIGLYFGGVILALAGLGVILFGIRQKGK